MINTPHIQFLLLHVNIVYIHTNPLKACSVRSLFYLHCNDTHGHKFLHLTIILFKPVDYFFKPRFFFRLLMLPHTITERTFVFSSMSMIATCTYSIINHFSSPLSHKKNYRCPGSSSFPCLLHSIPMFGLSNQGYCP
jgi:hypothetical protein